ncbi:exodeoxyribonuclease VII large subunit [Clostridium punense]|uniref:Exodeoxyribonuclease 7 large subunit n=1 Tax=Clostridium punense TaxID=1054297 RepID=A0ABS4K744_9CLOT|nr:exodeoxyribonuclease VII large subunit [Clostridium punense]MBP2023603.1 exodeoxyribonuclease VII large subunit [Clostridium punense]
MYAKILTVTAVNNYIKKIIDNDFILNNSNVKGELSNVKIHSSGHIYFSLKDGFSKINCVMFRSNAANLNFIPKEGMNVVVSGNISVYEKEGSYQLYCSSMQLEGEGELFIAFQKLKLTLENEGLFDVSRKKPLPLFPRRIGVITSPTGAAIRDIINVARRRNKKCDILIYPALVQGVAAIDDIVKGIDILNKTEEVDVIILARGGGSIEELWAFNEEKVARAIAKSKKPIVTGIGHDTDFTIADFVSDKRGATPSQAAEIVVGNYEEIKYKLNSYKHRLQGSIDKNLQRDYTELSIALRTIKLYSPYNYVVNQYNKLESLKNNLEFNMKISINNKNNKLTNIESTLKSYNPLSILNKGYSIIQDRDKKTISSLENLKDNSKVIVRLKDGDALFNINYAEEQNG